MKKFHISEPYYGHIKILIKPLEGRSLSSRMYLTTNTGEKIEIFTGPTNKYEDATDSFIAEIKYYCVYDTVKEMLEDNGVSRMLPGTTSIEDGVKKYLNSPDNGGFGLDESAGVCAIALKVLPSSSSI